ncbi:MAG TPA: YdjY domain-containing protein [Gemmataceae bacterium]|nr:YdjY domain-containing protein [Gemmataceae bacterium]
MKRIGILVVIGAVLGLGTAISSQEKKDGKSGVAVDKAKRTITIDAKIAPRKLAHLKGEIYPLEVIATWAHPKGKKAHETIVTIDDAVKPSEIHKALESFGIKAGKPVQGEGEPMGPAVNIYFLIPDASGIEKKVTVDKAMVDPKNGKPFPKTVEWRFTGSAQVQPDPNKTETMYGADWTGTFIAIFPVTKETVLQTSLQIENEKFLKMEVSKAMPKEGTPVKLVLEVKK